MQRFKNLLLYASGGASDSAAADRAARLAHHNQAALKMIAVAEALPGYARLLLSEPKGMQEILERERAALLERLLGSIPTQGLQISTQVLVGRPEREVAQCVQAEGHDLLLAGSDPDASPATSVREVRLLRDCPCPVWLVRPPQDGRLLERVLVALAPQPEPEGATPPDSPDPLQTKVLDLAVSLADWESQDLHVVHAWDTPGEGLLRNFGTAESEVQKYVDYVRSGAERGLTRLLAPHADRFGADQVHLARGAPEEVIPRLAETLRADLIILGTVARTGVSALVLGNTAETLLHRVRCSVLAVKPDDFTPSSRA